MKPCWVTSHVCPSMPICLKLLRKMVSHALSISMRILLTSNPTILVVMMALSWGIWIPSNSLAENVISRLLSHFKVYRETLSVLAYLLQAWCSSSCKSLRVSIRDFNLVFRDLFRTFKSPTHLLSNHCQMSSWWHFEVFHLFFKLVAIQRRVVDLYDIYKNTVSFVSMISTS